MVNILLKADYHSFQMNIYDQKYRVYNRNFCSETNIDIEHPYGIVLVSVSFNRHWKGPRGR